MAARLRTLLTGVAAVAASTLIGGCGEKPTPLVTVVAGGQSYNVRASGWCVEGNCVSYDREVPQVAVRAGEQVGVDVERAIARGTWVVTLESGDQSGRFATGRDSHYETFTAPDPRQVGTDELLLRVSVQESETRKDRDRVGQWFFRLKLRA